jgi:4-hydroxythreonine-4-phosphate dehydrogenase
VTQPRLESTLRILRSAIQQLWGIANPCILVCGLNPHAGEQGHIGREEIEIIVPLMQRLCEEGFNLIGPVPADTAFTPKYLAQADVILTLYHDQGLPVVKYAAFGQVVNMTLGLPFIRTSVDHGTALDLAGTGRADPSSLKEAMALAEKLALLQVTDSGAMG